MNTPTDQPEALRVAQALEVKHAPSVVLTVEILLDAARLLREQYAEIEELRWELYCSRSEVNLQWERET